MCMQLVQKPELYDVLVLPNLYGDILSDLAAGLVGGLGVAPGANIGPGGAVFEATHGSAPKYKGQNKVNPTALILSGVLMLRHLKECEAADRLEQAVAAVIAEGKDVTYDHEASTATTRRRSAPGKWRTPSAGRWDDVSLSLPRSRPDRVRSPGTGIYRTGQDEQQITQPIQIRQQGERHRLGRVAEEGHQPSLGPSADRTAPGAAMPPQGCRRAE